jgi:hypothetical protein
MRRKAPRRRKELSHSTPREIETHAELIALLNGYVQLARGEGIVRRRRGAATDKIARAKALKNRRSYRLKCYGMESVPVPVRTSDVEALLEGHTFRSAGERKAIAGGLFSEMLFQFLTGQRDERANQTPFTAAQPTSFERHESSPNPPMVAGELPLGMIMMKANSPWGFPQSLTAAEDLFERLRRTFVPVLAREKAAFEQPGWQLSSVYSVLLERLEALESHCDRLRKDEADRRDVEDTIREFSRARKRKDAERSKK